MSAVATIRLLLADAAASMQSLWRRVVYGRCQSCTVELSQETAATLALQAAGGQHVGVAQDRQVFAFKCGKRLQRCEGCPRWQAFRQLAALHQQRRDHGHVFVGAQQIEPDMGDRHGKAAEVDHLHQQGPVAVEAHAHGNAHPDPRPVVDPRAPGVEHAQHRADRCGGQGGVVYQVARHGAASIATADDAPITIPDALAYSHDLATRVQREAAEACALPRWFWEAALVVFVLSIAVSAVLPWGFGS